MSSADRPDADDFAVAGLMDRIYRRQRHVYDVTRKFYLLGRDQLIAALDPSAGGAVLEVGCGTGRNLILAARRYPEARFFGLDVSGEMLATAGVNIMRAGLEKRIALGLGVAARFDPEALFGRRDFARIFFSYSLSMIPEWRLALARVSACLDRDGRLLVVDFGQQEGLPPLFRKLLLEWLGRFHVSPRRDLGDVLTLLASEGRRELRFGSLYRGYTAFGELG